ncbi:hypothetical protein L208DRAFT_1253713 [Tricholoma matsutake]|nr:hypothetical protein L208DRAFT_1253713 [Tricholoma matsutake 945]
MAHAILRYALCSIASLHFIPPTYCAPSPGLFQLLDPQGVNLWKLEAAKATNRFTSSLTLNKSPVLLVQDMQLPPMQDPRTMDFHAQWFQQPLDHFSNSLKHMFHQCWQYWVNDRHYMPNGGGPVIVLDGGKMSGQDWLPFLDMGIVDILAKATHGVGVTLEHWYYGESIPINNLTTDSLQWPNNEQAAADSANFISNVQFDGIDEDLTAPGMPWIYYGVHMGFYSPKPSLNSITHAAITNWQYMDFICIYADPKCSAHLENSIKAIDFILDQHIFSSCLKALFGLAGLEDDEDFVSVLESPLGAWQSKNWDLAVGSTAFDDFCAALNKLLGWAPAYLAFNHIRWMVMLSPKFSIDLSIINYSRWIREHVVSECSSNNSNQTIEECFGTFDDPQYQKTTLDQSWQLWLFQVCTQWSYYTTGPPDHNHPHIISCRLTLEYESKICKQIRNFHYFILAFPPRKYFAVPSLPNIMAINALGDFDLAADCLAFIDGEVDPWRPDTPHSDDVKDREDTILRPFKLIPNAIHHWDENGLHNILNEPDICKIHGDTIHFVNEWL